MKARPDSGLGYQAKILKTVNLPDGDGWGGGAEKVRGVQCEGGMGR